MARPMFAARMRERLAATAVPLDEDHLVVTAMKRSGASSVPAPSCVEPLRVLSRSLEERAQLTLAGRRDAQQRVVDALVRRARLDAGTKGSSDAARSAQRGGVLVLGMPHGAAGLLRSALGADVDPAPPLDAGDDAADWGLGLADPSWELRWHVPEFAEWLDEHAAQVDLPPPEAHRAGGLGWLPQRDRVEPDTRVVVVRDDVDERRGAIDRLVAATVAERTRHSTRDEPDATERYVRWRAERFEALLEGFSDRADLVVDAAAVHAAPGDAADRVRSLLG